MSADFHRGRVERLTRELSGLESKVAAERDRAARERGEALKATQSITRTMSASTAQSKMRDAQRREERAVQHDKRAAQDQTRAARKRRDLLAAERDLERAIANERRHTVEPRPMPSMADFDTPHPQIDFDEPAPARPRRREGVPSSGIEVIRLSEETTIDAALELGKAAALGALSSVPVLGPVMSQVVGISWGDNRAARLERFAVELGRNVEALQERIDAEFVKHSDFQALAEESIERVVQRRNQGKIAGFAAAVAHSATIERPELRYRERFLDWLDELRPIHVQILSRLAVPPPGWTRPGDVVTPGQVVQSRLSHALADVEWDRLDVADLQRRGLLGSLDDTSTLLAAADHLDALVTPLGKKFLAFITGEGDIRLPT